MRDQAKLSCLSAMSWSSIWHGAKGHETVQAAVQEAEGISITGIQLHGIVLLQAAFADQLAMGSGRHLLAEL